MFALGWHWDKNLHPLRQFQTQMRKFKECSGRWTSHHQMNHSSVSVTNLLESMHFTYTVAKRVVKRPAAEKILHLLMPLQLMMIIIIMNKTNAVTGSFRTRRRFAR